MKSTVATTSSLDGEKEALSWYYLVIPLAEYLKQGVRKKD
jgi:hypothetical protein